MTIQGTPSKRGAGVEDEPGDEMEEDYAFGKNSVLAAIEAVRAGKCVVVTDDEDRENEGDIIFAAEKVRIEDSVMHSSVVLRA